MWANRPLLLGAALWLEAWCNEARATTNVDFERDVAPIFKESCVTCHGPAKQRAKFRLDTKDGLLQVGDDGPRVVPSDAEASLLLKLVATPDDDDRMPPAEKPRLTSQQVQTLRQWIAQGAPWPKGLALVPPDQAQQHWAFVPPTRVKVPAATALGRAAKAAMNPIDAFVLARLADEGLPASPPADRRTLIRRLWFDLVGLPPSPEAVHAFVADKRPDATERVIDSLLASPHFGERWARDWLDGARYADSDGFEKDKRRSVWPYRDWVVAALNADVPYDQFVIKQLAGDLLPGGGVGNHIATGFLRTSQQNEEGGADPEQFRIEALLERLDTLGKSLLGLTVGCAQCHNHKFDPISQEDFYRLLAVFNQNDETSLLVYSAEAERQRQTVRKGIERLQEEMKASLPSWRQHQSAWEARVRQQNQTNWHTLAAPFIDDTTGGQKYLQQPDGSFLAMGYAPTHHTAGMAVAAPVRRVAALRLELLTDPNLPLSGPGRAENGTCALSELRLEVVPAGGGKASRDVPFAEAFADHEPAEAPLAVRFDDKKGKHRVTGGAAFVIDGKNETAWGIDRDPGRRNQPHALVLIAKEPVELQAGEQLMLHLVQEHGGWNSDDLQTNNLGRFRISVTDSPPLRRAPVAPHVWAAVNIPASKRSANDDAIVFEAFRGSVPAWRKYNAAIEKLWARHPEGQSTLTVTARPLQRVTHVFERGDFLKLGKQVEPGGLPLLQAGGPAPVVKNRLDLARWLMRPDAPTVYRVVVNRLWQAYFGQGLHSTPEDFGTQAPPPLHRDLMDHLVFELATHGFRLKHLHRLITMSATYQQSSRYAPQHLERDPTNQWLSRGPRVRLGAEQLRDASLSVAGLLNVRMGGPPVMPPAPAFLFVPPSSYGPFPWIDAVDNARFRRGLYVFRRRSTPFPSLQLFDAPNGDVVCVRRNRSNTPLQALATLNDPMFLEAARGFALQMLKRSDVSDRQRIRDGFERLMARQPDTAELDVLLAWLEQQRQQIRGDTARAEKIVGAVDLLPAGAPTTEAALYTLLARLMLNLDEALTKE
ncbi:MAG: PSD1 and planctomycete cytochrome C domain-containing protein [Deltaproteobacteria bacterium]|nr:PSD1 and planctomycete cytochrome C domain-containing protein [Deltaproteobacteria bacterium]